MEAKISLVEQKRDVERKENESKRVLMRGYVNVTGGTLLALIIGVGVAIFALILMSVLAGQTYQISEPQISAITNTTIKGYVTDAIIAGFKGLKTTGDFMPLIVLAVVAGIVLYIVLNSIGGATVGGAGYGGVL